MRQDIKVHYPAEYNENISYGFVYVSGTRVAFFDKTTNYFGFLHCGYMTLSVNAVTVPDRPIISTFDTETIFHND
uniref:Uncharacterized protein n=1 Tax=Glossina palpalis gambiensis TaxID=67801 RepID=A0A1B0C053_9MUSC